MPPPCGGSILSAMVWQPSSTVDPPVHTVDEAGVAAAWERYLAVTRQASEGLYTAVEQFAWWRLERELSGMGAPLQSDVD
jgi:hypothetical protein